jgi:hypothetical protein
VAAQLEAFRHRCSGTLDRRVQIPPRSELFFRPEEVDRRSERVDSPASILRPLSDPQHDAGRSESRALRRYRELQRRTGVMAAGDNLDRLAHHRSNPQRVDRATDMALASVL